MIAGNAYAACACLAGVCVLALGDGDVGRLAVPDPAPVEFILGHGAVRRLSVDVPVVTGGEYDVQVHAVAVVVCPALLDSALVGVVDPEHVPGREIACGRVVALGPEELVYGVGGRLTLAVIASCGPFTGGDVFDASSDGGIPWDVVAGDEELPVMEPGTAFAEAVWAVLPPVGSEVDGGADVFDESGLDPHGSRVADFATGVSRAIISCESAYITGEDWWVPQCGIAGTDASTSCGEGWGCTWCGGVAIEGGVVESQGGRACEDVEGFCRVV